MKTRLFLSGCLLFTLTFMGCAEQKTPATPEASATPTTKTAPTTKAETSQAVKSSPNTSRVVAQSTTTTVAENQKITTKGIGAAKVGMTLGQLKKELGSTAEFKVQSPFIVDFDAIAVSQNGKVQFYILYPAGDPLNNTDKIEYLLTDNPNYRTEQGVGPGTPIKQAEAAYGDATLSYNLSLEGREYVTFAKQPAKNLSFRLGSYGDDSLAGVYVSKSGEYKETKEYKDNASIRFVGVACQGESCAQS